MRLAARMLAVMAGLAGCGLSDPGAPPDPPFGSITTLVGGRTWISQPEPDQVIAEWNPAGGYLALEGEGQDPSGDRRSLALYSCHTLPLSPTGAGTMIITAFFDRLVTPGAYGFWRVSIASPAYSLEALSTGAQGDHLTVDHLDAVNRTIRGSFRFHAATQDGAFSYLVTGRFAGRVEFVERSC